MGKNINELPAAAALDGTELVEVLQGGVNSQTTAQDIADLGGGASYLSYVALLSQTGTDAPVATVLENTLGGTVVWTRNDVGDYTGTLAGVFTVNKTWFATPGFDWSSSLKYANIGRVDADSVQLFTTTEDGTAEADDWAGLPIEIRVYP